MGKFKTLDEAKAAGFPIKLGEGDLSLEQVNFMAGLADKLETSGVERPVQAVSAIFKNVDDITKSMSEDKPLETVDLKGVEIFQTGNHKGIDWTDEIVERMVADTNRELDTLKPYLKLGHNDSQPFTDGQPSLGWLYNIRKQGPKVLADVRGVPKTLQRLIDAGAYRRISAEVAPNRTVGGKAYPYLFRAAAVLGADTPEIKTLNDLPRLYYTDHKDLGDGWHFWGNVFNTPELNFNWTTPGTTWGTGTSAPIIVPFVAETQEGEVTKAEYDALKAQHDQMAKDLAKEREARIKTEVVAFVDKLIAENRIKTDTKDKWNHVLFLSARASEVLTFADGEEPLDKALKDLLTVMPTLAMTGEVAGAEEHENSATEKDEKAAQEVYDSWKATQPSSK